MALKTSYFKETLLIRFYSEQIFKYTRLTRANINSKGAEEDSPLSHTAVCYRNDPIFSDMSNVSYTSNISNEYCCLGLGGSQVNSQCKVSRIQCSLLEVFFTGQSQIFSFSHFYQLFRYISWPSTLHLGCLISLKMVV